MLGSIKGHRFLNCYIEVVEWDVILKLHDLAFKMIVCEALGLLQDHYVKFLNWWMFIKRSNGHNDISKGIFVTRYLPRVTLRIS